MRQCFIFARPVIWGRVLDSVRLGRASPLSYRGLQFCLEFTSFKEGKAKHNRGVASRTRKHPGQLKSITDMELTVALGTPMIGSGSWFEKLTKKESCVTKSSQLDIFSCFSYCRPHPLQNTWTRHRQRIQIRHK